MKNLRTFGLFLAFAATSATASVPEDFAKTLELVKGKFHERYALAPWKARAFGWTIDGAAKAILREGLRDPNLTEARARELVQDFFYSARDYHAKSIYAAGGQAALPISVRSVGARVFVTAVADDCACGAKIGDEILKFDGVSPIRALAAHLTWRYPNHRGTDVRDAERRLANPYGLLMERMPTKDAAEVVLKSIDGKVSTVSLKWKKSFALAEEELADSAAPAHPRVPENLVGWLRAPDAGVGPLSSYFPKPEKVLWESAPGARFPAWIAEFPSAPGDKPTPKFGDTPTPKKIGWIRVSTFAPGAAADYTAAVKEFEATVAKMNESADALILDELGNGGGMADYMYALASYFFDKDVPTFKFSYRLFDAIVKDATETLPDLEKIGTDAEAKAFFGGDDYFGYPVDLDFAKQVTAFYRGIVDDAKAGMKYGKFRHYNASKFKPNPRVRYLKKLFVLADEYSASCADFFPALFQDTRRAEVLGGWTAGAGAFTGGSTSVATPLKTNTMIVPIALGLRLDGRTPIENLGVRPSRSFRPTADDYRNGFRGYGARILSYVRARL